MDKLTGATPVMATSTQAVPAAPVAPRETAAPAMGSDSASFARTMAKVEMATLKLVANAQPSEESNRKNGVTFKQILKSAESADKKGFSDTADQLYSRAIALADCPGELVKVAKAASGPSHQDVAEKAMIKGGAIATDQDDLLRLAKLSSRRGFQTTAGSILDKAITTCNDAKGLRKIAELATDRNLQGHSERALSKIVTLPGGK